MQDKSHKKVIVIAGPTASGKTALSVQLAKKFNTSVISCDSRQCYKEMSIGTAAPTKEEQQGIPHYFIHSHSIHQPVSAGTYKELAMGWLEKIFQSNDLAIITGGTGLYLQTLTKGIHDLPEVSAETRAFIKNEYSTGGLEALQQYILAADPEYFSTSDTQNPARLMRAAEIIKQTGRPYSSFLQEAKNHFFPYQLEEFVLDIDRSLLYEKINLRVEKMMKEGLLEEVKALLPYRQLSTLHTVGYSELFEFLDGKYSLDEAIDKVKQHSRNYAKRQLTWFRNKGEFHFASPAQIMSHFS